ncbi:MAG TPA: ribonuclease III [Caldithrix abyssi]|uniref:Ribonuclease 3 n=1 Tax=Caldithrix abyssi TaxID=187145 RepID=A0A7V4WWB3_CALAY|nr:ribonuclease III [Caldithrix abyssi]
MIKNILQKIMSPAGSAQEDDSRFRTLEQRIHFRFNNKELLRQAFKHRSYLNVTQENASASNERLEFLGDAVLDLIVTEHLYQNFPQEDEGRLSKKKSVLVSRKALGNIAAELAMGEYLFLDKGEEKTGGRKRLSNLANLFESLLGAIYLDGGYDAAREFVRRFLLSRMKDVLARTSYVNYKSELLELSQARGWGVPEYRTVEEYGPDHRKEFVVAARIRKKNLESRGKGLSKKRAEQMAARNLLRELNAQRNSKEESQ